MVIRIVIRMVIRQGGLTGQGSHRGEDHETDRKQGESSQ
jgi:hypothetical protein